MDELSRNSLFAEAVLGVKRDTSLDVLRTMQMAVVIDEHWVRRRPGQLMFVAASNLLARLFDYCPNLDLVTPPDVLTLERIPPLRQGLPLGAATCDLLAALPKPGFLSTYRALASPKERYDLALVIGTVDVRAEKVIHISCDGWLAYAGTEPIAPRADLSEQNPFGALIAAGWGASLVAVEIFRSLNADVEPPIAPRGDWFSALTYATGADTPNLILESDLDLGDVVMVGAGALGSAATYTLAALPHVSCQVSLVDDDTLSSTNIERHVTSTRSDAHAEVPKVEVLKAVLETYQPAIKVNPVNKKYEEWSERDMPHDLVLLGPDNAEVRCTVQFDLPRVLINAATGGSGFTVSRHDFLTGPCAACLYRSDQKTPTLVEDVSRQFGVDLQLAQDLVNGRRVFDADIYQRMCERGTAQLRAERARMLFGLPFPQVRGVVCSEAEIRPDLPAATIGFVSFLPGVLMVAELVKAKYAPHMPLSADRNVFRADVFRLGEEELAPRRKSRLCRCKDEIMLDVYKQRWARHSARGAEYWGGHEAS